MDTAYEAEVLLTQTEAAEILKKSTAWMERSRWDGTGPPYRKIGRHVRYPKDALLEWINGHPLQTSTSQDSTARGSKEEVG